MTEYRMDKLTEGTAELRMRIAKELWTVIQEGPVAEIEKNLAKLELAQAYTADATPQEPHPFPRGSIVRTKRTGDLGKVTGWIGSKGLDTVFVEVRFADERTDTYT